MYKVQLITALADMAALKDEWNDLWKTSVTRTPYQRWEWNYSWIKASGQGKSLYVLTARKPDGELVGIAPLRKSFGFGAFKSMSFISQETSNYTDFILKKANAQNIIQCFVDYIENDPHIASLIIKIAEPSPSVAFISDILKNKKWDKLEIDGYTKRLIVNIGDNYENYLAGLSREMRRGIKRATKKLRKSFNVDFLSTDSNSDFEEEMNVLFRLNSLRWGGDPKKSHLTHRECYRSFRESDETKIFILTCDNKAVGALSAFLVNNTIFAQIVGFDYSIYKISLGKVFFNYLFLWAVEHGFQSIDFSSGEQKYKFSYNPEVMTKWEIAAFKTYSSYIMAMLHDNIRTIIWKSKRRIAQTEIYRLVRGKVNT